MQLSESPIAGVFEIVSEARSDHRGAFARLFCRDDLEAAHRGRPIVQINLSRMTRVGAIRGLHFQYPPKAEAKWVRCLKGRVFDVAVDLRRHSPTFLSWHAIELDSARMNAILIPERCAQGFQALEPNSELLYLHTESYSPAHEAELRFDDSSLAIDWPLPATDLSDRDRNHALIDESFEGIVL